MVRKARARAVNRLVRSLWVVKLIHVYFAAQTYIQNALQDLLRDAPSHPIPDGKLDP